MFFLNIWYSEEKNTAGRHLKYSILSILSKKNGHRVDVVSKRELEKVLTEADTTAICAS